jgi:dual 3',5'-cyclic-AMP and -GMP phosphodiesterase 11
MLMTASDIAASSKPWHVQKRVAGLVTAEFIVQGDKERQELHIQPQALMDRERQHELPQLQIRWIADICLPLYKVWVNILYKCNLKKSVYIRMYRMQYIYVHICEI